ncbi:SH3 domain-containing protein [Swingsia samuiensis]|nr:SH3 domain-containing protein [Swingsia samuiensis]
MSGPFFLQTLRYHRFSMLILLGYMAIAASPADAAHHKHPHASKVEKKTNKVTARHLKKTTGKKARTIEAARAAHKKRLVRRATTGAVAGAAVAAVGASVAATAPSTQTPPTAPVPDNSNKGTNTGLPLPRFAALRADKVYMRRGPGDRYPIDWVYHRRGLPVEVEREFDVWRLVEDSDGQKGWVHQATLYGSRTFVIPGLPPTGVKAQVGEASAKEGDHIGRADARILGHVSTQEDARSYKNDISLMSHPEEDSSIVALLQPGTVGNIKLCPQNSQWCQVSVKGYQGWLPRRLFWGLLPGETIQPN